MCFRECRKWHIKSTSRGQPIKSKGERLFDYAIFMENIKRTQDGWEWTCFPFSILVEYNKTRESHINEVCRLMWKQKVPLKV